MRDTQRKLSGVALRPAEPVVVENMATFARPTSMYPLATVDVDHLYAPPQARAQKVFDASAAIRRFDDIPTVNRVKTVAKPRIAKGTLPSLESARARPRCVLPQEVDVSAVLDAIRRAR